MVNLSSSETVITLFVKRRESNRLFAGTDAAAAVLSFGVLALLANIVRTALTAV
jgi:hypothetical protein